MGKHVIKFDYDDGVKLARPELWCGAESRAGTWYFTGEQHLARAVLGSVSPCKNCVKAIIKELDSEL